MILIKFTGNALFAFEDSIPASCVVRNEINGWRKTNDVVLTGGSTQPRGLPYQPRQFPPGRWLVTKVVDCDESSVYWPVFIGTAAWQYLPIWSLGPNGGYYQQLETTFTARGYGIHYPRYEKQKGVLVKSNTTLGCIGTQTSDDALILGEAIREAMGMRQSVYIEVPPWEEWV